MQSDRITRCEAIACALPVKPAEDLSRGEVQNHVFVRLETARGVVGWGEARALPSWTGETLPAIAAAITQNFGPLLLGASPFARNAIFLAGDETITGALSNGMPVTRSAIDMALHDLQGKLAGVAVHELLGGKVRSELHLSASLRSEAVHEIHADALALADYRSLKVKLHGDVGLDAERLAAVGEAAPQASLWLDGNQRFSVSGAVALLERIRSVKRCVCLQQPIGSNDWFGMARLRQRSWLPLAVDEGCFTAHDALRLARLDAADLITLKLCKAGGLRDVVRQAEVARVAGLELLGSGLTESGVGLAAALHVYSTLPLRLPPQLNGAQYLDDLLVTGLEPVGQGGGYKVPDGPGLGVEVDEDRLRSYAFVP